MPISTNELIIVKGFWLFKPKIINANYSLHNIRMWKPMKMNHKPISHGCWLLVSYKILSTNNLIFPAENTPATELEGFIHESAVEAGEVPGVIRRVTQLSSSRAYTAYGDEPLTTTTDSLLSPWAARH